MAKTSQSALTLLFFLGGLGPLFADLPENSPLYHVHSQCGTIKDRNFSEAFYALKEAIDWCFGYNPDVFPDACNDLRDPCNNPFYHCEGSLLWETRSSGERCSCKRVLEKAVNIDVPLWGDQPGPEFVETKQVFRLHKDYFSLLYVFELVQQDVTFIYDSNINFLHRHIHDSNEYYKECSIFRCISFTSKDFEEREKYYAQKHQQRSQKAQEFAETARIYCKRSLDDCIARHSDPRALIDRGLFDYLDGGILDALDRIGAALKKATPEETNEIRDKALLLKGRSELEAGLYADAILTLSEFIDKNPNNHDVYVERAGAYFELGDFDSSLNDYLASQIKPEPIPLNAQDMIAFSLGLTKGIAHGGVEAGAEFIPSILSSLHGISQGLWAFAQDPVQISKNFVNASQNCIQFIKEHSLKEAFDTLVPELKDLIEKWDQLEQVKQGEIVGNIIGKYGVDIFIAGGVAKGMKAFRELKRANDLLTFEAMAISERNRALIKLEAATRAQRRQDILKKGNLKIQQDKQGKHIVGHGNYQSARNRSILEHPNPQKLVDEFAGKGRKINDFPPGTPNYQEVVNFAEFVGYVVDEKTGAKIATTWGKIHYAKDGVHIVPTEPRYP